MKYMKTLVNGHEVNRSQLIDMFKQIISNCVFAYS